MTDAGLRVVMAPAFVFFSGSLEVIAHGRETAEAVPPRWMSGADAGRLVPEA